LHSSPENETEIRMSRPPMVGVPRLARWLCGPSTRIGCPVPWRSRREVQEHGRDRRRVLPAQVGDEPGAEQQADEQRRRARRAGAEADVADEVEDAGEAQLFGDQ